MEDCRIAARGTVELRQLLTGVALCGVLLAAGCGDDGKDGDETSREKVRIGAVVPLTGDSVATGRKTLQGVRLAAALVNEDLPDIDLPLAEGRGLPNLGGARIEVIAADHRGDPETGAAETERLIKNGRAVAVTGSYFSSVTLSASRRAQRLGVPFVNGDSSSPALTETRGRGYFFRTGPSDETFANDFFDFLDDLKSDRDALVEDVAILHENTEFGTGAARATREAAARHGYEVVATISHGNGVRDVTRQAARIEKLKPDALLQASYTDEAILFTRTFRRLGYAPNLLAYGAGYSDAAFFDAVGRSGNFTISRAAWTADAVRDRPAAAGIAREFEERYGSAMDENSARTFTAALTLFGAINEAGTTSPDAIREALAATDIAAGETIMPWEGIRFDDRGQNELARGVIVQYLDGAYRLVWPFDDAKGEVVWPVPPFARR
jgi:branched-chain amino acid transport system substrate-binding protein